LRTNLPHILFICIVALLYSRSASAQDIDTVSTTGIPAQNKDHFIPREKDSLFITPLGNIFLQDSTAQDTLKETKTFLKYNIEHQAETRIKQDFKEQKIYLYNQAEIHYGDMSIKAGLIILNNKTHEVYAYGIMDSTDTYSQKPVFNQGGR